MIQTAFMAAWNWDARPFPAFPLRDDLWGDAGLWPFGSWIDGKGPFFAAAPCRACAARTWHLFDFSSSPAAGLVAASMAGLCDRRGTPFPGASRARPRLAPLW